MRKAIIILFATALIFSTVMAQTTINVSSAISSFISSVFSDLSPAQQSSLLNAIGRATTVTNTVTVLPTSQLSSLANSILSTLTSSTTTSSETTTTVVETTSNAAVQAVAGNGLIGVSIAVILGLLAVLAF